MDSLRIASNFVFKAANMEQNARCVSGCLNILGSMLSKIRLVHGVGLIILTCVAIVTTYRLCRRRTLVDIRVSMAGNPAHEGHMHMIALAVQGLLEAGYQINKVKVYLSSEEYLKDKVKYCNESIQRNAEKEDSRLLRVFLSRDTRIRILREVIRQAKQSGLFSSNLEIDYCDDQPRVSNEKSNQCSRIVFQVCGADYAEECGLEGIDHAVIVSRNGKLPIGMAVSCTKTMIVVKNDGESSGYSSSKIQEGAYELLPESVREEFKTLHQAAQQGCGIPSLDDHCHDSPLNTRLEQTRQIPCPIAQATGLATTQGFYINPSGQQISLRSGADLLARSRAVTNVLVITPVQPRYAEYETVVVNQDCLDAAEGELKNGAAKVAVLMLASPIEPGGAMEEGNNGQEEDLCRRSNIFGFMWDQARFLADPILYNLVDVERPHQIDPQYSSMANNRMIHVPNITLFRAGKNNNYAMLEQPFEVGMLVSPGLDALSTRE